MPIPAFLDGLTKVLRVILIVLLAAMVLIMFFQAIMRYVFANAQPWCEELTLYLGNLLHSFWVWGLPPVTRAICRWTS